MAFERSNFGRSTLAYNGGVDSAGEGSPVVFTYRSDTDNIATISAANYFSDVVYELNEFDIIFMMATDGFAAVTVDTVDKAAGTITVNSAVVGGGPVGTGNIQDGAVTTPKLAAALQPVVVAKVAGEVTTTGGSAFEVFAVPGVLVTDTVIATLADAGSNGVSLLTAVAGAGSIATEFSADPGNDAIMSYVAFRAV